MKTVKSFSGKMLAATQPLKGSCPEYTKKSQDSIMRKHPSFVLFFKWAKYLNKHLTKEDTRMANKQMKRCLVTREMQIKMMTRYHWASMRRAIVKKRKQNIRNNKCQRGCTKMGLLHPAGGTAKWDSPFKKQTVVCHEVKHIPTV